MENSVEGKNSDRMALQVDRLSLLPNELLDHIFDLAHSIDTPSTGPLSKHHLPFYITGIYRRISLTKPINIAKLVRKIGESPDLAKQVKTLHVDAEEVNTGVIEAIESPKIEHFFRQLVHLEWLDLGTDHYEWLDQLISTQSPALSTPLRHINSGAPSGPQPLVDFTSFTTLRSLHVTTYRNNYRAFDTSAHPALPLLTHLTISGVYAESLSIASFCILCPALTHLTLNGTSPDYTSLLEILPASLVSLELRFENSHYGDAAPCDQELSRFTALRHLSIGHHLFSYDLPTYLDSLIALESLELGEGHVSTDGLIGLLTKLPSLRHLKLDLFEGSIGTRLEIDATGSTEAKGLPAEGERIADDWVVPDFVRFEGDGTTLEAARKMLGEVHDAGVQVEGTILEAVNVMEAYYLELANVATYRCFRNKTFDHYLELQYEALDARLPPLDLDSLDPNNLDLVKTEVPDEGWFALSLEAADE
ncbi:hypothetical protein JCM5353_006604 [Sporobolomyces roseus]